MTKPSTPLLDQIDSPANLRKLKESDLPQLADELRAGMDVDVWPLLWNIPGTPRGLSMSIVCSIMRRLEALEAANILRGVADDWQESLRAIAPEEATHN